MNLQVIKKRIRKTLAYSFTGLLFLLITSLLVLQMPPVQNAIVGRLLRNFSNVSGFTTKIGTFSLLWFDRVELFGVTIIDPEGNEMVSSKRIVLNFSIGELLNENDVNIDGIVFDSSQVYFTKVHHGPTRDLNFNIFVSELNKLSKGDRSSTKKTKINIGEAILNQCQFTYWDPDQDSISRGFDFNHFQLDIEDAEIHNFYSFKDTTQFEVNSLLAKDQKTDFRVKQLATFFRVSNSAIEFTKLNLKTDRSIITDTLIFSYKDKADLGDFISKVKITARLNNSKIHPEDIALFVPTDLPLHQAIDFTGNFDGKVKRFRITEMEATFGNSTLRGSLEMDGLPHFAETFIILDLLNSRLDFKDLDFLIDKSTMNRIKPMGPFRLSGQFLGYVSDFVANGDIVTDLGRIKSDINFKVNEANFDHSTYHGKLTMQNFDIGKYFGDTIVYQKVDLDGNISGQGLTRETANFKLQGKINSLGIRGYRYQNIITDARFASEFFNGKLTINDPNLKFTGQGSIDFRDHKDLLKIQATLDTANLQELNLAKKPILVKTKLDVDISGLHLDSLTGTADFKDFSIITPTKSLHLDDIVLHARRNTENKDRMINLESTLVNASIYGNYLFSDLLKDIGTLQKEVSLNLRNHKNEIDNYYKTKTYSPKSYKADLSILIRDLDPISHLLNVDLDIRDSTLIQGSFRSGHSSIFRLYTLVDSLSYQKNIFTNSELEVTLSKISDSTDVLAIAYLNSESQQIGSSLKTENLTTEAVWNKNHIEFFLDANQFNKDNYIRMKGAVDFLKDSTKFKFLPSMIHLLDRNWHIDKDNLIVGNDHEWHIQNLEFANHDQSIRIDGHLSEIDTTKKLLLDIEHLDMALLNVVSDKKFNGQLNAEVELQNYFRSPSLQNKIFIDSLSVNDFYIGNVNGKNIWNTVDRKFDINLSIVRERKRVVSIYGDYTPQHENPLNIKAKLEDANVRLLGPFLDALFSDLDGEITGNFSITGTLQDPQINGQSKVKNGRIRPNYTQVIYDFNGIIGLKTREIYFQEVDIIDSYQNHGKLSGRISHHNFYKMFVDLRMDFKNLHLLNTGPKDNNLFYGQGFGTGSAEFAGPVDNLVIKSNAKTEKNTKIFIPIQSGGTTEKKEYINFISLSDTTENKTQEVKAQRVSLSGVTMDLNLDVTTDAYCEIIFDLKAGDIIRGRGVGDLHMLLDTKGEFNMFGTVEFEQGWYNFTLYDIINKEFEILKGSRISWYGDPYGAILDINATYNQLASFAPIITNESIRNSPELRRKYPTQVLLKLNGPMLSPQINFDILAKDLPTSINVANNLVSLDFMFESFKNKLDEQELKRQVFSLIVLRKFSPPDAFNTSGTLYNSVSELLSNQLSYWMSQVDENLEIDVDLGTMDQEARNTFQLRLSYTFLNGRLRITRDGTFGNNTYGNEGTDTRGNLASVAGDWTVDYFLTADGKFKVKMYNRTNYNQLSTSLNNQNYFTTGVSLQHVQSFNDLKDLLKIKKSNPEIPNQPTEESPGSILNKEGIINEEEEGG